MTAGGSVLVVVPETDVEVVKLPPVEAAVAPQAAQSAPAKTKIATPVATPRAPRRRPAPFARLRILSR
jgi:hypothetical protein